MAKMLEVAKRVHKNLIKEDIKCSCGCGRSLGEALYKKIHQRIYIHPSGDAYVNKAHMISHKIEGAVFLGAYCPLNDEKEGRYKKSDSTVLSISNGRKACIPFA